MSPITQRFVIGIDLGTTNSAVAYADLQADPKSANPVRLFKIPQLTGPGEVSRLPVLPSFLYLPGAYDLPEEAMRLPWSGTTVETAGPKRMVGAFARDHGAKIPSRLVSSAKSWLCHPYVDRKARILPWGSGSEVDGVSPVQATAAYLTHIRAAWNSARGEDADLYLENQRIVLTVPASFDEVARELTVEAAAMAGLKEVSLLEEPLAAFYSWLIRHELNWNRFVSPGELILICDVGGGTTDFTLISLRETDGSPRFERIAVGDHLILGGDNMDLALGRSIENRLGKGVMLAGDRWKTLCHQCRQAKEAVLDGKAASRRITVMGEGSRLIGGTLSADLGHAGISQIILEGFFPLIDPGPRPPATLSRKGITEIGLPYEPEPAITRHLGWFLDHHQQDAASRSQKHSAAPDCILFNGGALKPEIIQERIREAIRRWFGQTNDALPRVLDNPNPDLAVALGAAYYGMVKEGRGVRVGSGSARSYYIGVSAGPEETAAPDARKALCLVERGLDEGSRMEISGHDFQVLTNQPVAFDLYSSSFRSGDRCGELVTVDDSFTALPPIQTIVQFGKKGEHARIPVSIEALYTEIGTLALWCRSRISDHRWQLQFQLRSSGDAPEVADSEVFDAGRVEAVLDALRAAFLQTVPGPLLDSLVKDITRIIDRPREKWPLSIIRSMTDALLSLAPVRLTAPDFESRWLNLLGFCLRPGFGDGMDGHRIQRVWKIYKPGPIHSRHNQVRSDWWIFWRRIAGGLSAGHQRQFFQDVSPLLFSAKTSRQRLSPQEYLEIQMAAAAMERLTVKDKLRLGSLLITELAAAKKASPQLFWALSRIGARELLYGPADRVIPPAEIQSWIHILLTAQWPNPAPAASALLQLARKTGDRIRDIDPDLTDRIYGQLTDQGFLQDRIQVLLSVIPFHKQESNAIFGEDLPSGLILHTQDSISDQF